MTVEPEQSNPFVSPSTLDQASDEPSPPDTQGPQSWSLPAPVAWAATLLMGGIFLQTGLTLYTHSMLDPCLSFAGLVLALALLIPKRGAWIFMVGYLSLLVFVPVGTAVLMVLPLVGLVAFAVVVPTLGYALPLLLLPTICYAGALACLLRRRARAFYFRSKV